jgi:1-acyl-sn-glycerol-3-phosphate acyltransferase
MKTTFLIRQTVNLLFAVSVSIWLTLSLLSANFLQCLTVLLWPFSSHLFRRTNRWMAQWWWGSCVWLTYLGGQRYHICGDDVPHQENALVIANHQTMVDVIALMSLALPKGRLGDMKWFVKDSIKYVPGIGWGLYFLDSIFVKRAWAADKESILATFSRILKHRIPLWLLTFPEGTRWTPSKHHRSNSFAARNGWAPFEHVMVPHTKGFQATVSNLGSHITAVYDVTIAYPRKIPTLWAFTARGAHDIHLHVRRYPIDQLPRVDADLAAWLLQRFRDKDRRLAGFLQSGRLSPI